MIEAVVSTEFLPLTRAEWRQLLRLARESIRSAFDGEAQPFLAQPSAALSLPSGAFVSLHQAEHLRGCIGTLLADAPLHQAVARLARSAAFDDPRFPPLTITELSTTDIEISRLSSLIPVEPGDVCPGRHGVSVALGNQRGVFLPQVATHYGWDRDTLLREVCLKALLPADAWQRPGISLMVFEAEVFGEGES